MELTSAAMWLNTAFAGYDRIILTVLHFFAQYLGFILTPLMKLVTLLGEKGALMFLLGIVLMCFRKTRKIGVCVFGAVGCGALITNFILKDAIARPRPFETVELFRQWWIAVGSPAEDGFSFPSGHVTAMAAGMVSLRLWLGKKFTWPAVGGILVMMISRNYLMAHYPSDVLAAAVIGTVSAFIAYGITLGIFMLVDRFGDYDICIMIQEFDLREYIEYKRGGKPVEVKLPKVDLKKVDLKKAELGKLAPKNIELPKLNNNGYQGKHLK